MDYSLKDLLDRDSLQKLCNKFTALTKTVTALLDLDGNILIATGWRDICTRFHRVNPHTASRCKESDTSLSNQLRLGEKYTVYQCKNGLVDAAVPILIDGNHVGNFFTGQFLFAEPDTEFFRRQAIEFGFDESAYLDALSRVPVFTETQVQLTMDFLCELAQVAGEMGLNNLKTLAVNEDLKQEIIERKQAEEKLRISEEKFKAMAETSPLAIYMSTGIEQKAEYINPTFVKLFGYTLEDVPTAEKWWPLAYPDENYRKKIKDAWQAKIEKAIQAKSQIEPMDVVVTCKDGAKKNISWGFISTDRQNWAFGLDLTGLKQAEEELKLHKRNLEKLVDERTAELRKVIHLMSGREIRMAELKSEISALHAKIAACHKGSEKR